MKKRAGWQRPMRGALIASMACRCCVSVSVESKRASEKRGAKNEIDQQMQDEVNK